jgi:polar amino acid transport system substrate-binding protein
MKKQIKIILSLVFTLCFLVGCGNTTKKEEITGNGEKPLKVAIDLKYPPFMYMDEKGNPAGFEVDIAKAFGEYLGREVEISNTDFPMLIPALETEQADIIISDMTVKEERKQKVDFSSSYRYGRTLALVNKNFAEKNNVSDEMSAKDFFAIPNLKTVGLAGTISVTVPQNFGVQVTEATEISSALMEVSRGTADILVGSNNVIGDQQANKDTTIIYRGIKEYSESAMAVKKGNTELLEKANEFIKTIYEDGGFYKQAGDKYDKAIGEYLKDDSLGLEYMIYPPK